MKKSLVFLIQVFIFPCALFALGNESVPSSKFGSIEKFEKTDRVLILAPHPDDETIGCAGVIQSALKAKAEVRVVYLTNGDHNQLAFIVYEKRIPLKTNEFIRLGEIRRNEAVKAMNLLGVQTDKLTFLGYPDYGTFTMFRDFWQSERPFKSWLTRISSVPYQENFSFGASYLPESILLDLKMVLLEYKPNKVFVSHPADVNVDHKALYLYLEIALSDVEKELPRPKLYPYLIHCVGWPLPRHYHPELTLSPPSQFLEAGIDWRQYVLSSEDLGYKYKAILSYPSQTQSSAFYLLAFARKNELFGSYEEVDLRQTAPVAKAVPEEKAAAASLKQNVLSFFGFSRMFVEKVEDMEVELEKPSGKDENVGFAREKESVLIRFDRAHRSGRFNGVFTFFGYSYALPFAEMPKVTLIAKGSMFKVFNGRKKISADGVGLEVTDEQVILKVPLKLLGGPNFALVSVKAYTGGSRVLSTGFRKLLFEGKPDV